MSGAYTRFGSHALLEPASIGAAPMVCEQHHTTETTPDSNAIDCSDRLTPGKSRYRTSGFWQLRESTGRRGDSASTPDPLNRSLRISCYISVSESKINGTVSVSANKGKEEAVEHEGIGVGFLEVLGPSSSVA
jgi:hypothetical protein